MREHLSRDRISEGDVFDTDAVQTIVSDHLSGRRDRGHAVWLLLQFELWRQRWLR